MRNLAFAAASVGALALAGSPAQAAEYIFDATGDSADISFNGFSGSSAAPINGLGSSLLVRLLSGVGTNTFVFSYALTNTSTSGGASSRVSGFAFNSNPDVKAVLTMGDFSRILKGGNYPNTIGNVEICLTGSSACAGGAKGGATLGDAATGTFSLSYSKAQSSVNLSDFYVRYQSLSGLRGVTSASGQEIATAVPEPGTWMLMILGLGAVGFAMRRRQNTSVRLQLA